MKNKKKILLIVLILLVVILSCLCFVFLMPKTFTISFDSVEGTSVSDIKIKDGKIFKFPENPVKEGSIFGGWTDENGNIVTKNMIVTKDIKLTAYWIKEDSKTFNLSFDTDGGNEIDGIKVENGKIIILPITPVKEGYVFGGWLDSDGKLISNNMKITKNINLKAYWIKEGASTAIVTFNTDGGSSANDIVVENGKVVVLPTNPTKEGYVFAGWVDENGKTVTKDTVINGNTKIKATWKEPYTCPKNCVPSKDGKTCTKTLTASLISKTSCPSGYSLVKGKCLDVKNKYHANSIDVAPWWSCNNSSEYMYSEIDESGLGAFMWCAKQTSKVTKKVCPSGYTKSGSTCKKTQKVNCTAN